MMNDTPTILVVDDEPANRKLLSDLVAREGYTVLTASGGSEALALLERDESVDLVLLDMMMPTVDGMAVLTELQKRGTLPGIPVLVVTAHDERSLRLKALAAGAIDFITKPVDRIELFSRIRTLVELKRLRDRAVSSVQGQLKELHQLLQLRFFQSPVAEIVWDQDFKISAWNPAAEVLFEYPAQEVLGSDARFLFDKDSQGTVLEDIARRGPSNKSSIESLTRNGRIVVCEWHSAQLTSTEGEFQGVSSVVLDLTDRKRLQNALTQSQKMEAMGQLAGGVAHDFNNILSVVMSYGAFLLHAIPQTDPRYDDVNEILKAAQRAAALTKQLLAFSRQQPAQKRAVDLNESLVQLRGLLTRTLGKHIKLAVSVPKTPVVVRIDPVQFDQITLNLAVNARDAMPSGGELHIELVQLPESSFSHQTCARLTVTDTGVGMDEATKQRAFEPFFTTKEVGRGTGLGLATCFGIIEEAGGQISLRSALGQGTTATVLLPLCGEKVIPHQERATDLTLVGNGEQILVADDDETLRKIALRSLTEAGYVVHLAADGNAAIDKINQLKEQLSAVFIDVLMPGPNGFEVAQYAKKVAPNAAILMTAGFLDDVARRCQHEGLPILWKPVTPLDMVREIRARVRSAASASDDMQALSTKEKTCLLLITDPLVLEVVRVVLTAAGYSSTVARTPSEAEQLTRSGLKYRVVICDLVLPGSTTDELLSWLDTFTSGERSRVFLLDGGVVVENMQLHLTNWLQRIVQTPIQAAYFRELLAKMDGVLDQGGSPSSPLAFPNSSFPPSSLAQSAVRLRKESVLIVDDDRLLANAICRILGEEFQVILAESLSSARLALSNNDVDVIVLDVTLSDGSGLELLNDLRGRNSEIPVVLTTGALSSEVAAQAVRNRISEFLPKPFDDQMLVASIRRALDGGRASRLRAKLLSAHLGGDDFVNDIPTTERNFESALSKLYMVFQPIVRAGNHTVFGYEALLRCDEPSLATPPRLLAAAEVLGRLDDVGRAVRASVAKTMCQVPAGLELMFVNIHPAEVAMGVLTQREDPLLSFAGRVILEITERASLDAGPRLDAQLKRLRDLGYRFAVDDLGEGYAGLTSLVHLQPDIAKIDMSLVRNIDRAPLKRDIVAALVDMARRSGIVVVAEGVETIEESEVLIALGCDLLQGYLFAKPGLPFPVPQSYRQARVNVN